MDEAVNARSIQRRQVLEEIISTEEGYIADVKFLMNVSCEKSSPEEMLTVFCKVYVTLLASIPTISLNLRTSINQNLNEIVELHEDILGELHRVVPHSEYSQMIYTQESATLTDQELRPWRGITVVLKPTGDFSRLQKLPGMTAEASIAADVARVFGQKV
jgi:hypothetical protein